MGIEIKISPGGASPIFKQIVDQVRLAISTGRLLEGEQLPSVRALAERLLVNPNTVAKAYAELSSDKLIDTQPGRGVFVNRPRQMYTQSERQRRIEPHLDALLTEGLSLSFSLDDLIEALKDRFAIIRKSPQGKQL